jgi:voltage-gated potassium channel
MTHFKSYLDSILEVLALYIITTLFLAMAFCAVEGIDLLDAYYWAFTTTTSTGYGDVVPKTGVGKIIAVFLMHLLTVFLGPLLAALITAKIITDHHLFSHDEQEQVKKELEAIRKLLESKQ